MRAFHAIGAALLMAWAMPATSHADVTTETSAVSPQLTVRCSCPEVQHRHAWYPRRHARFHARHWRHWRPAPVALAPPPYWPAYNPPIPSPYDSAYGRVMTQYMRSRTVGGEYLFEPGYLPRPPVPGLPPFRIAAGGAVFEYDLMADGYIPLAQSDAPRALPVTPGPAAAAPAPR
jgi:hypothetical protein